MKVRNRMTIELSNSALVVIMVINTFLRLTWLWCFLWGHWLQLGVCMCVCVCMCMCVWAQSCLTLYDPMDCSPPRLFCPWDFPDKNTGAGCHSQTKMPGFFCFKVARFGLIGLRRSYGDSVTPSMTCPACAQMVPVSHKASTPDSHSNPMKTAPTPEACQVEGEARRFWPLRTRIWTLSLY